MTDQVNRTRDMLPRQAAYLGDWARHSAAGKWARIKGGGSA